MPGLGVFAAIAAISSVAGTATSIVAAEKQEQASKKAQRFERRRAEVENVRNARRAIAERRALEAGILASQESVGTTTNSAISGAVGATRTQTAANIGFANNQLASSIGTNQAIRRGERQARNFGVFGQAFGLAGNLSTIGGNYVAARDARKPLAQNPTS